MKLFLLKSRKKIKVGASLFWSNNYYKPLALPYLEDDNSFSQTSKDDNTNYIQSDTAIESDEDGVVDVDARRRRKRDSESGSDDDAERGRCGLDIVFILYSGKFTKINHYKLLN